MYQKATGLYLDLYVSGQLVIAGVLCRDRAYLLRQPYLGFFGDLVFVDYEGTDDPQYVGLGSRWQLRYIGAIP